LRPDGRQNVLSAAEAIERVTIDLEKLRNFVQEARSSALATDQPAMRAVAAEALQKATALCSLLVTLLQDMPLL
jgi:predicted phage tail protein